MAVALKKDCLPRQNMEFCVVTGEAKRVPRNAEGPSFCLLTTKGFEGMKRTFTSVCLFFFLFSLCPAVFASTRDYAPLLHLPRWLPLDQRHDTILKRQLQQSLAAHPDWRRLIEEKKMAVGLVDLASPTGPRFASVNGSTMMYAASLPKIAVLLTAFVAFEEKTLPETEEIYDDLNYMIRLSSNTAATRMIDRLGLDKIATVLTDPRFKLFDPARGGGLWVGKRYAKSGMRHPDPIAGLSHGATADQVCRFYYLLAAGKIINPRRSAQMLDILADSMIHHKFVGALEKLAPAARLYRKSGTWHNYHADSVLVWGQPQRRYILVALVQDEAGGRILGDLVPEIEKLVVPATVRAASVERKEENRVTGPRRLAAQ